MEKYLAVMTDQYRQKYYKKGVFGAICKNTANVSFLTYLFFGAVFVGCVYGIRWSMNRVAQFVQNGEADMAGVGYVMTGVFVVFAVIAAASLLITVIRHARGPEKWKERCAKLSGYTVEEINQFEHQALEEESRVISLQGAVAKAASGQKDGIITQDYIYLKVGDDTVIRLSDVMAACLVQQTVKAGKNMPIDYLIVGVMGKGGTSTVAECTKESGLALIEYLKEKCPGIYTADERVLESREYDMLWAELNHKTQADR